MLLPCHNSGEVILARSTRTKMRDVSGIDDVVETSPLVKAAGLAPSKPSPAPIPDEDDEVLVDDDDDLFENDDVAALNQDPDDVAHLDDPPLLDAKPKTSDIFGRGADAYGRATAPKLWNQSAKFPTATQFRVWIWENGTPTGLGAIDAKADEDDFIRRFESAMPKPGQGRAMFTLRPLDIRGRELGQEITLHISEHHATLQRLREQKRLEAERGMTGGWGRGPGGDVIVNPGDTGSAHAFEEMGRMFESAVDSAERQRELMQARLEEERERLRLEEKERALERVTMAERAVNGVEKMSERLLEADRARAEETIKSQKQHTDTMLTTLTAVFQQQQMAAREQAERAREADALKMAQDREFFDRQRAEAEQRRRDERDEFERKRAAEQAEFERKRAAELAEAAHKQMEERARLEAERTRLELERKHEIERIRIEAEERRARELQELERRRQMEEDERNRREKVELDRWQREREEWQRLEDRRREEARLAEERRREEMKYEAELRREEAKLAEEKRREEAKLAEERRRLDDERRREEIRREDERKREEIAREREIMQRLEDQRRQEAREAEERRREELRLAEERRRQEAQADADRRKLEAELQLKQLEQQAAKEREHAERMMEMARMEREAQREAALQREKMEREAREQAEKDRQRQHDLSLRELEISKDRDREHQERMMALARAQQGGGIGGLTDLLGLQPREILSRVFGGGGESDDEGPDGKSWPELIVEGLGAVSVLAQTLRQQQQLPGKPVPRLPAGAQPMPLGPTPRPAPVPPPSVVPPPQPQPQAKPVEEEEEDEAVVEERISTTKLAKDAGIPILKQKKARGAILKLAKKLSSSPEGEWANHVQVAIMEEPTIYAYIMAVSVEAALDEANVDSDLKEKVIEGLRSAGATLPFTVEELTSPAPEAPTPAPPSPAPTETVEEKSNDVE